MMVASHRHLRRPVRAATNNGSRGLLEQAERGKKTH